MKFTDRVVLRWIAGLVLGLCALAVLVGFIPGIDVFEDKNDCIGRALARAFSWHGGGDHSPCERNDVLLRTEAAGGWPLLVSLVPVALGALALRRWPKLWIAALWPLLLIVAAAIFFAFTFELDLFSPIREVPRWPAHLLAVVVVAIAVVLAVVLLVTPIVAIRRIVMARRAEREAQPEPFAQARVVKMSSPD